MVGRLMNGFLVTGTGEDRAVFHIINGSPYQIEPVAPLTDLAPGYYDSALKRVPAEQAEALAS